MYVRLVFALSWSGCLSRLQKAAAAVVEALSPQEVRWQWRCTSGSVIIAHINAKLLQHMHSAAWCSGLHEDTAPELWLTWAPHVGAVTNQYRVFSTQHIHICWCALSCSGRRLSNASFEDGGCVHQNEMAQAGCLLWHRSSWLSAWPGHSSWGNIMSLKVECRGGRSFASAAPASLDAMLVFGLLKQPPHKGGQLSWGRSVHGRRLLGGCSHSVPVRHF